VKFITIFVLSIKYLVRSNKYPEECDCKMISFITARLSCLRETGKTHLSKERLVASIDKQHKYLHYLELKARNVFLLLGIEDTKTDGTRFLKSSTVLCKNMILIAFHAKTRKISATKNIFLSALVVTSEIELKIYAMADHA